MNYNFSKNDILNLYQTIGLNVKKIREVNKLTQLELSYLMDYKSVSLVSSAELCIKGKHFNIEHLYKIAQICNVDITEFFKDIKTTS